jgi:hypothetical protein
MGFTTLKEWRASDFVYQQFQHELVLLLSYKVDSKYTRITVTRRIFSGNLKKWSSYIVNESITEVSFKILEVTFIIYFATLSSCAVYTKNVVSNDSYFMAMIFQCASKTFVICFSFSTRSKRWLQVFRSWSAVKWPCPWAIKSYEWCDRKFLIHCDWPIKLEWWE